MTNQPHAVNRSVVDNCERNIQLISLIHADLRRLQ